jgi:hypothetical protein
MLYTSSFQRVLCVFIPLLCSSIAFSQVQIKETISISPKAPTLIQEAPPTHTLRFEGTWDVPIFARMYTSGCNGKFDTGTSAITYEVPLTAGTCTFDFQPRVAELLRNQVCNVTLKLKLDGTVVMQASASFAGGSSAVFALWPGDYPSYTSPYNTSFFLYLGDSLFYEEGWIPWIEGINSCDPWTWDPASPVTLQIVSGTEFAQFYDYNTRQAKGISITGTGQQINDNYELVPDGILPDSSGALVTVQATSGGITQTASVKIKPYFFQLTLDSPRIDYGSGTAIRAQTVDVDGNLYYRTVMPSVRVRIVDSLTYGTLWYGGNDSSSVRQIGDTLTDITSLINAGRSSGLEARFYAIEKQPKDSINVQIAVEKTGEGLMIEWVPANAQPFQGRDTVRGATQVTVVVPVTKKLKIVDHAPWAIWPYLPPQSNGDSRGADRPGYHAKRAFSILVKDGSDQPLASEQVSIFTQYEEGTGGHGHGGYADTGGTIPAVKAMPDSLQGIFYRKGIGKNPLIITTNENGIAVVDSFIASQASGKFLITARLTSDTTIMDTVNLQVKVPGLIDLGTGDYWNLTGTTSRMGRNHLSNHWCTQRMKDSLKAVLKDFFDWTKSEEGGGTAVKLGINDMSLEWGGAFDIPGTWVFKNEHSFHRVGLSIDIDNAGIKEKDPKDPNKRVLTSPRGRELNRIMTDYGGTIYDEGPIHFGFEKSK